MMQCILSFCLFHFDKRRTVFEIFFLFMVLIVEKLLPSGTRVVRGTRLVLRLGWNFLICSWVGLAKDADWLELG